jgi:hypothetical protein
MPECLIQGYNDGVKHLQCSEAVHSLHVVPCTALPYTAPCAGGVLVLPWLHCGALATLRGPGYTAGPWLHCGAVHCAHLAEALAEEVALEETVGAWVMVRGVREAVVVAAAVMAVAGALVRAVAAGVGWVALGHTGCCWHCSTHFGCCMPCLQVAGSGCHSRASCVYLVASSAGCWSWETCCHCTGTCHWRAQALHKHITACTRPDKQRVAHGHTYLICTG